MPLFETGNHITLSTSKGESIRAMCRKSVGFNGPTMVEGVNNGAAVADMIANGRDKREFLQTALAAG